MVTSRIEPQSLAEGSAGNVLRLVLALGGALAEKRPWPVYIALVEVMYGGQCWQLWT